MNRADRLRAIYASRANLDPVQSLMIERRMARELSNEVQKVNRMSKLKALGAAARSHRAEVEARAEKLTARLASSSALNADACAKLEQEISEIDAATAEIDAATAEMSNGGPPITQG